MDSPISYSAFHGQGLAVSRNDSLDEAVAKSPEKYKVMVDYLVQYTAVLVDIAKMEKEATHRDGKKQEQLLKTLRKLESVLARCCLPVQTSSCRSPFGAVINAPTSQSKQSYLLSTLSDLKQYVLVGKRPDSCDSVTPLAAAAMSLYSVPSPDDEGLPAHSKFNLTADICGTSYTNEEIRDDDDDDDDDYVDEEESRAERRDIARGNGGRRKGGESGKKIKRLNKTCTNALTAWLLEHLDSPCPSPQEKIDIAKSLHLEPAQVMLHN